MKLLNIVHQHARSHVPRTFMNVRWSNTVTHIREDKSGGIKVATEKEIKEPFVKNFFLGRFDTDFLVFPEALEIERLRELENIVAPIDIVFRKDISSCSSQQKLEETRPLGIFGLQVPQEYGGLNLNATEYARVCEVISQDGPAAIALTSHQTYGLKGLLEIGNKTQKLKYLPKLASGEWISAFCLAEPSNATNAFGIDTEAKLLDEKWYLKGSKVLISSDGKADLMTVIARTEKVEFGGQTSTTLSAFLVERTFEGITFENTVDLVGNRGVYISEVRFNNTPIPSENLVGEIGDGIKLSAEILGCNRFSAGSFSAGILKTLLQKVSEHCVNQKQLGKSLMDFQLLQKKIAKISFSIYILESLTYLTSGILDTYAKPDASVESAIVKVLSSEMLTEGILESQNILGGMEFFKNYAYDTILRHSKVYMLLEGSNEVLRMFIALSGLQHAGKVLQEDVHKTRNPAMNPTYVLKKLLERRNHMKDNPKLTLGLNGFVHPTLKTAAEQLEYCVLRLQYAVEILLHRHGRNITEKEIELDRLTDIVMGLYTMTAVLARASRSYCTGIQNAEFEVNIAMTICYETMEMVKHRMKQIEDGPFLCFDNNYVKAAEKAYSSKGYFLEHPLSRNIF